MRIWMTDSVVSILLHASIIHTFINTYSRIVWYCACKRRWIGLRGVDGSWLFNSHGVVGFSSHVNDVMVMPVDWGNDSNYTGIDKATQRHQRQALMRKPYVQICWLCCVHSSLLCTEWYMSLDGPLNRAKCITDMIVWTVHNTVYTIYRVHS